MAYSAQFFGEINRLKERIHVACSTNIFQTNKTGLSFRIPTKDQDDDGISIRIRIYLTFRGGSA